ncbi:unnamed protein product [Polarella glacialis]|uniref:Rhodanese domain-containing protein n=1 Tax=Polarella glacialis TaxID=89957 RepID=A0A813DMU4_POLGL|nr:unnamed protein product [Polarella glacialis]
MDTEALAASKVNCDPCKELKATKLAEKTAGALETAVAFARYSIPDFPSITAQELLELLEGPEDQRPLLEDCRSAAERSVSIIRGASTAGEARSGESRPVVTYCTIGSRCSQHAALLLQATPDANVRSLHLSLVGWCHAGGELVKPETSEPTKRVHAHTEDFARMFPGSGYEVVLEPVPE